MGGAGDSWALQAQVPGPLPQDFRAPPQILQAQGGRVQEGVCAWEALPGISRPRCPNIQEKRAYTGHMQLGRRWDSGSQLRGQAGPTTSPCSRKDHLPKSTWASIPALLEVLRPVTLLNLSFLLCKMGRKCLQQVVSIKKT